MTGKAKDEAAKPLAFFRHDTDASLDVSIQILLDELGMEGYGRWWRLLEFLAYSDEHKANVQDPRICRILAKALMCDEAADLFGFLGYLAELDLIVMQDDGWVFSRRLNSDAERVAKLRVNGAKGGRPKTKQVNQAG